MQHFITEILTLNELSKRSIFYFKKNGTELLPEQIGSILISIFIGYSFYKLLNLKPVYWFLGYALLFYLLDNFVASYFIKLVYQIFNLM